MSPFITGIGKNQENLFSASPNPADKYLVVYHRNIPITSVSLYTATGEMVLSAQAGSSGTTSVDICSLCNGVYIAEGAMGHKRLRVRFIKR
jgi:hypothetical protein